MANKILHYEGQEMWRAITHTTNAKIGPTFISHQGLGWHF